MLLTSFLKILSFFENYRMSLDFVLSCYILSVPRYASSVTHREEPFKL